MDDFDEREEELSSLSAIYPELLIDPNDQFSASLELAVIPTRPLLVRFVPSSSQDTTTKTFYLGSPAGNVAYIERDVELTHLPPLTLKISLPERYPVGSPPTVKLSTQYRWLPRDTLMQLEEDARKLWDEYGCCQILFAYIDHLQQAAERGFDLDQSSDGCLVLPMSMEDRLLTFSSETQQAIFNAGTYDCGICIEPKKGSACYQLKHCGHIFCRQCLQDFYNNAIKEGDVAGVKCLDPDCAKEQRRLVNSNQGRKATRSIPPRELLAMGVEEKMVRRYVELKRKKKLEADKNTIYCPRKWCQGIARRKEYPPIPADLTTYDADSSSDEDSDPKVEKQKASVNGKDPTEPPAPVDRLAVCEKCQYAFCRICYTGWHGEFARCYPRDPNELSAEDKASYDWILTHTSPCPTCNSPTQKTMGCNHMKCFQCNTHFCYLCGAWLDGQMPYVHFNTRGTDCYQRLFELEEGDEGQGPGDGRGFGGMRRWEQMAIDIAREAEAEEAAAVAQAEEDARAAEATMLAENRHEDPAGFFDQLPIMNDVQMLRLDADAVRAGAPVVAVRNRNRQRRNPFPARPPAAAAANAVRDHERNRRGGAPAAVPQVGGRERPALVVDDREQAELQRFIAMARRDEEDAWDSDDLGDDDEGFVIR